MEDLKLQVSDPEPEVEEEGLKESGEIEEKDDDEEVEDDGIEEE